jgi:hypothetical protein
MTVEDAGHISKEQRQAIIDSYPAHERDARISGIPSMGSGRVFALADDMLITDPFSIPEHWPRIIGMDFGWTNPTAAVMIAHDRDTDSIYVTAEYSKSEEIIPVNAAAIKQWGNYPVAWPTDVEQKDKTTGQSFRELFRNAGLKMLPTHAQFLDGGVSVEAGVAMMLNRFHDNRLRIFSSCRRIMQEIRLYHRKDGLIVKQNDHLIDAARYAIMMVRMAKTGGKTHKITYDHIKVY